MYKYNVQTSTYEKVEIKDLKVLDQVKFSLEDQNYAVVMSSPKCNELGKWEVKLQ